MRIYLAGQLTIEAGDRLTDERQLPGKQGLLVSAYLVLERRRPVSRDKLAEVVWGVEPPAAWDSALSAIVSKLRGVLRGLDLPDGAAAISGHRGRYQMHLPSDTWVDVEAVPHALDEAEGALRRSDAAAAWGPANVATVIASRPFLAGVDSAWAAGQRERLRQWRVRGLDCLAEVSLRSGQGTLALQHASEAVSADPLRELGYQRLMRTHLAMGDRAGALRAYERCRLRLNEELGVDPSPQTEAIYLNVLRAGS